MMCGCEIYCRLCYGLEGKHGDTCPIGIRRKPKEDAAAREKHLADIEFLNQNARGK